MPVPEALTQIAVDVHSGKTRRAKIRTILGYYGLKRRGSSVIAILRSDLAALRLATDPDLVVAGMDDQVRFLPGGAGPTDPADPQALEGETDVPQGYRIDPEASPSGRHRYRILLRGYDALSRLEARLGSHRLGTVPYWGQNSRREDRNQFPFCLVIEPKDGCTLEDLRNWIEEAVALEAPAEDQGAEEAEADTLSEPSPNWDGRELIEHADTLHEDLRALLTSQMDGLEERLTFKVDEIRFEAVRNLAKELKTDEANRFLEEYDEEMKDRIRQYEEEIAEHQREISLLSERIQEYEQQAPQEDYDPGDAYSTMANTVRLFRDLCEGTCVQVHDSADASARRSACVRRREVLQFLLTLKDLGIALYCGGGVSQPLKEWFRARGYEYAPSDSESTSARYGEEREILLDGEKVRMEEHVTLFPKTSNCVTVYFVRDNAAQRLVVGYVGRHLRTSSR